ncbi:Ankyrin repeat and SOCS box protein 10, partial [Mesitornis unicolor]
SPSGPGHQNRRSEPLECRDLLVQNALFTGDLEMVQKYFTKGTAVNLIIESRGDELRWTSRKFGLWSLSYAQELTTPLHITASRGYTDCLQLLLRRGAAVDFAPGGKTALHEACAAADMWCKWVSVGMWEQTLGVTTLYETSMGRMAAPLLTSHPGLKSPLQGARSRILGLLGKAVKWYSHGGRRWENEEGQTPLTAACAQPHQPQDMDRYYRVCRLLVDSGASINAADRDRQYPLHLACKNANAQMVELLLARGANVNVMNYSGNMALHNILQVAAYRL